MISDAIYTILSADTALTGLLNGPHIYPGQAPDSADGEYIVFREMGRNPAGGFNSNLAAGRFRFFIYAGRAPAAPNYRQCRLISAELRRIFTAMEGIIGDVCILTAGFESQYDTFDSPALKHGVEADFLINFTE